MKWEHLLLCYFGDMRLKNMKYRQEKMAYPDQLSGGFLGCWRCNRATEDMTEPQTVENKPYLQVVLICLANHMVIF